MYSVHGYKTKNKIFEVKTSKNMSKTVMEDVLENVTEKSMVLTNN